MGGKTILVSNRLPWAIAPADAGFEFTMSSGGLVSGLQTLYDEPDVLWLGWADVDPEALGGEGCETLRRELAARKCAPVYLDADLAERYYGGLSNSCIWPLFHNFPQIVERNADDWEAYRTVNERFCEAVCALAEPGDTVWVHDYHLMLLPGMLREAMPGCRIGFFLHIPFPHSDTFRMLPWREEVLRGIVGSDLVGFHTAEYADHFIGCCTTMLGVDAADGVLAVDGRSVSVDAFPLGIDFAEFERTVETKRAQDFSRMITEENGQACRLLLSVERLDYSKGIPERLEAFDRFLEEQPEWRGRVVFLIVSVPSRENVESYRKLKEVIDGLVGRINGKHATMLWTPVKYYYRSIAHEELCGLYAASDVMLVTPLSDGMNLVCKEYLACHQGGDGVLVLSETAGAASELGEALIVNPFDCADVSGAIERALTMDAGEKKRRCEAMMRRLAQNTSSMWAQSFRTALVEASKRTPGSPVRLGRYLAGIAAEEYARAKRRLFLLDYDGTLAPFTDDPRTARPDASLESLMRWLGADEANDIVIVSGRDRNTMEAWFRDWPVDLVAEHGLWHLDRRRASWRLRRPIAQGWRRRVHDRMSEWAAAHPGSFIEQKDCSLALHYRACSAPHLERDLIALHDAIASSLTSDLMVLVGDKVLEVKTNAVDKGSAAMEWIGRGVHDFMLIAGDDVTDEDMIERAPDDAWTIKVGGGRTSARFAIDDAAAMRDLLGTFILGA